RPAAGEPARPKAGAARAGRAGRRRRLMPPEPETLRGVLYVIVCGAPPARDPYRLVQLAQAEGWDVCVITTPSGRSFIDPAALEAATGHPCPRTPSHVV